MSKWGVLIGSQFSFRQTAAPFSPAKAEEKAGGCTDTYAASEAAAPASTGRWGRSLAQLALGVTLGLVSLGAAAPALAQETSTLEQSSTVSLEAPAPAV